jgi:hypothetical protein
MFVTNGTPCGVAGSVVLDKAFGPDAPPESNAASRAMKMKGPRLMPDTRALVQ